MDEDEITAIQALLGTVPAKDFFMGVETAMRRYATSVYTATGSTVDEIKRATVFELNADAVRKFYSADCVTLID